MKVDYLIVGGGLAGANLALECIFRNRSFCLIDDTRPGSSMAAAGLINPITGRNYVRSWKIESTISKAFDHYRKWEELVRNTYLFPLEIRRVLNNIEEENKWFSRASDPLYDQYLDPLWIDECPNMGLKGDEKVVRILGGYRLQIRPFLSQLKSLLTANGNWRTGSFSFEHLNLTTCSFGDIHFGNIVFCKGAYQKEQPFSFVPIRPNLGEVLFIKIPREKAFEYAVKKKAFISPFDDDVYWVGGTYKNVELEKEVKPDFERLSQMLKDTLDIPYQIVGSTFGIRPTVPDRRPLVGCHPEYPFMAFLNGLGTKGASLGPFCAEVLMNHLENQSEIEQDIALDRYI